MRPPPHPCRARQLPRPRLPALLTDSCRTRCLSFTWNRSHLPSHTFLPSAQQPALARPQPRLAEPQTPALSPARPGTCLCL